jgi:recombination protein RecR
MRGFPTPIQKVVDHFDELPGIGPKHAARLALYLVSSKEYAEKFARDLDAAIASVRFCTQCQIITDSEFCETCKDLSRNQKIICVVAHIQDVDPIERTGKHTGTYHILHGTLSPIEGITPDQIKLKELLQRITKQGVEEVILALDATAEGEATVLYLTKVLKELPITVTKLARGIPVGSNIEYTDEVTLSSALENRRKL